MKRIVFFFAIIFLSLIGCSMKHDRMELSSLHSNEKKIILIVIDSLLEDPLESLIKQGKVPAFAFLKEKGFYTNRLISSFPTMSVTIDSTILTGSYPDQHHIPALRWYNIKEKRLVHYGDGFYPTLKSGIQQVKQDVLYNLNNKDLSKDILTIHEELVKQGRVSASINSLVYRSNQQQTLTVPKPFSNIQTMGPPYLVFGSFHRYESVPFKDSYLHHYGINNEVSVKHLVHLIKANKLPSFTMVYFPDLDHEAHKNGKLSSEAIIKVDKQLQSILGTFSSWKNAIDNHIFIVMGDSGVSKIKKDKKEAIVDLEKTFQSFHITTLNKTKPTDQLSLAANERMAYVYLLNDSLKVGDIVRKVKNDSRLDTISWKNSDWVEVIQGGTGKSLKYRIGTKYRDPYGQKWEIFGDASILGIHLKKNNEMTYEDYPDGLMRLYAAHHSHSGHFILLTTKPGYEMQGENSPIHAGGGAHGSFHQIDSYVPMFIAGTEKRPKSLRMIDLKNFILNLLK